MKKLLITFAFIFTILNITKAQDCKCNPYGFGDLKYTTNGASITVRDGHQFSLKCKQPYSINGNYKCDYTTKICDVKLKATIKNSAGVVVKNYENFSFPLAYEFETGGNYVLEITPICGKLTCPPIKFYFTVYCDTKVDCKCNDKNGWNDLSIVLNKETKPITCGSTFDIKKTDKFGVKGTYKCIGDCDVILKGSIYNSTGFREDFPAITLDGMPLKFPEAGNYKLVITPVCNKKECAVCIIYVNVN